MNHSVFAIELCLRLEPRSSLRDELRDLVVSHPASTSPGQKWELLRRVSELLLDHEYLFEKGCWDFFDTDAKALSDYDMWSNGLITEEGARGQPSTEAYGEEARYMTFTIALLVKSGTQCDRDLSRLCSIPEEQLWKKATFVRILRGLAKVNFAFVKSDVLYLIPGEESWGLTAGDLTLPKFEYLRTIEAR